MKRLFSLIISSFICLHTLAQSPKLTVAFVIDQFAYHELLKFLPTLTGGIKYLHDNGVRYVQAFHPHSMPETAVGHATIGTGCLARDHGIIGNIWHAEDGSLITCDADTAEKAAVFGPAGKQNYGVSPQYLMVDTLSDQLKLFSYPHAHYNVWTLALKSRAAVLMAGRLGKPLWFDSKTGMFTSSAAYMQELPGWVADFNKTIQAQHNDITDWEAFLRTPPSNQILLDLVRKTLEQNKTSDENERLVLFVSMNSLDLLGHVKGPRSPELAEMITAVDTQLQSLIEDIYTQYNPEEVLFALTADHGVFPILEEVQQDGIDFAHRIPAKKLIEELNNQIAEKFGLQKMIINFKMPQFYLDEKHLKTLDDEKQKELYSLIKDCLLAVPGIKRVWSYDELQKVVFDPLDLGLYYQHQLYPHRTGDIIVQVQPYNFVDIYEGGTGHGTPYSYDTHVPLFVYQKNKHENNTITDKVYVPQLTVSLAELLSVPRPSASTFNLLPGLKYE
jgi:hypothetical protein